VQHAAVVWKPFSARQTPAFKGRPSQFASNRSCSWPPFLQSTIVKALQTRQTLFQTVKLNHPTLQLSPSRPPCCAYCHTRAGVCLGPQAAAAGGAAHVSSSSSGSPHSTADCAAAAAPQGACGGCGLEQQLLPAGHSRQGREPSLLAVCRDVALSAAAMIFWCFCIPCLDVLLRVFVHQSVQYICVQ
jgi:hypothetical protein